ncbi:MAG: NifU family protein [Candidatus Fimenecus sp.]
MEEYIASVIRPKIQGDGGEVCFAELQDDMLTLVFQGECSKCLILDRCVRWIEQEIENDLGKRVTVNAVRKKPFFWDT